MGSSQRQPYLVATTLDQPFLDQSASNLECRLEFAADIEAPGGSTIHVSDRNKYIVTPSTGYGTFYQARTVFPVITRTLGDWLSDTVEFSSLTLEVSNVDGAFNQWLPGGAAYDGFVGKDLDVTLGLAELQTSYNTIFSGRITDVGGVARSLKSVTFTARDLFDVLNVQFPPNVFQLATYPFIDASLVNTVLPVIYGDWTYATDPSPASVPAICTNGADLRVNSGLMLTVSISTGSPGVFTTGAPNQLINGVPVQLYTTGVLPSPLAAGVTYYTVNTGTYTFSLANSAGGTPIATSGSQSGTQQVGAANQTQYANVSFLISDNPLGYFAADQVYLKRGDLYYPVPKSLITGVGSDNRTFSVVPDPTNSWIQDDQGNTIAYVYDSADTFYVRVKGKTLTDSGNDYSSNIVWQARDILLNYGALIPGSPSSPTITAADLDVNWATYRDKTSPAQSAIATIASRVWVQDQTAVLEYVKSMLEQVRLELFISRTQTIKINSLHFEDWNAAPSYTLKQWDIQKDSLQPAIDVRNNFNRAQANYNFLPDLGQEARVTPFFNNAASITQVGPKPISKILVYPNLYVLADVVNQLSETLRLASATFEVVALTSTWRSMLLDLGDFVFLSVAVGGIVYSNVPCMIRSIGYDPAGLKLPLTLWSFAVVPFPGYTPGYAGTVGGYQATITQE